MRQRLTSIALLLALVFTVACNERPVGPADGARMSTRGITLADWTPDGYASPSSMSGIDAIAALGANTLVLIVTAYQDDASGSDLAPDPQRTPGSAALQVAEQRAVANGMRVVIKPHVDLESGEWRGTIGPRDAAAWFEAYAAFVVPLASFAESINAATFVVGTELAGTITHDARWRELIAEVRAVFSGSLAYAASWDEMQLVPFWDALDLTGVDFYAPVATNDEPRRLDILKAWQPWLNRLEILHGQTNKPILLTEIGYRSIDGAGARPFEFGTGAGLDPAEQADLYWAAIEAVAGKDWIDGVMWWNWLASGRGGIDNDDYTPQGKPAETELHDAWSG